jgi:deoxyribodipyrimidine photo-lyase
MDRIVYQNSGKRDNGEYVLYWMQQSQRAEFNPALEKGIEEANRRRLPLIVLFVLIESYAGAGRRHYRFMLQGLEETRHRLAERGIGFLLVSGGLHQNSVGGPAGDEYQEQIGRAHV